MGRKTLDKTEALAMGRKGGFARADALTAKRRKEIARKAAAARWGKRAVAQQSGGDRPESGLE